LTPDLLLLVRMAVWLVLKNFLLLLLQLPHHHLPHSSCASFYVQVYRSILYPPFCLLLVFFPLPFELKVQI
jgi:hypothetical protein